MRKGSFAVDSAVMEGHSSYRCTDSILEVPVPSLGTEAHISLETDLEIHRMSLLGDPDGAPLGIKKSFKCFSSSLSFSVMTCSLFLPYGLGIFQELWRCPACVLSLKAIVLSSAVSTLSPVSPVLFMHM